MRRRVVPSALLIAALVAATAACSADPPRRGSDRPPAPTLPAGTLRGYVLQPADVQRGLVPLAAQTGPADAKRIAGFSADPAAAARSLTAHGFRDAYVVQYGDPATRAVVTNVVARFATEAGAHADLAADLAAARSTGEPFDVVGLGEQAGGTRGVLDAKARTGTLVTLRWRVDETTWLLAVGAPHRVDEAGVRRLADLLVTRFRPITASSEPS